MEEIRRSPVRISGMGLREVIAHYEEVIRGRGDASIIMGHSFGGAITQILLDRGTADKNKAIALTPRTPAARSAAPGPGDARLPLRFSGLVATTWRACHWPVPGGSNTSAT